MTSTIVIDLQLLKEEVFSTSEQESLSYRGRTSPISIFWANLALLVQLRLSRSCGKVVFSLVSVCSQWGRGSTYDHMPMNIGRQPPAPNRQTWDPLGSAPGPVPPLLVTSGGHHTGDLFKLVHLRTPQEWHLITTETSLTFRLDAATITVANSPSISTIIHFASGRHASYFLLTGDPLL